MRLGILHCLEISFSLAFLCEAKAANPGDEFFAKKAVHPLSIELSGTNFTALNQLNQQGNPRAYVHALLREGEQVYADVGLHLKGNASFRPLGDRPCLTVKFDEFHAGQNFHGLTKIHLNNSLQDPSFLTMVLCEGLFNAADVPTPRSTYAQVKINGRDRGLYILNEGFDKKFLKRHFKNSNGSFFEAGVTQEITEPLRKMSGAGANQYAPLQALVAAACTANFSERMQRLGEKLDLDRFVSMLAMDVMTWNWDGYGMNRNNYRVYHDPRSDKVVFFPGGMDQMFWEPQGAIFPPMKGLVARSLLETPQGRKLYYDRMSALLTNVFRIAVLTNRLEELRQAIRPLVAAGDPDAARILDHSAVSLSQAIIRRAASIGEQLKRPPEPLLIFNSAGEASLSGWREHNPSNAAALDRVSDHSGAMLHIRVERPSITASWRTRVAVPQGKYRFEGKLRTRGVQPLKNEKGDAADLRVTRVFLELGRYRFEDQSRGPAAARSESPLMEPGGTNSAWRNVSCDFETGPASPFAAVEIDLVCELRAANKGEVWFDLESLRLRKRESLEIK